MKRFNVYKIVVKTEEYPNKEKHKLLLLKTCDTEELAEHWLKDNCEKFVKYTIIPEYCTTPWDSDE
jgi:hypothetical protein